jgi:hypothetical protein
MRRARQVGADIEAEIRASGCRAVERGERIDEPCALLEHAVCEGTVGFHRRTAGCHQAALDRIGRE